VAQLVQYCTFHLHTILGRWAAAPLARGSVIGQTTCRVNPSSSPAHVVLDRVDLLRRLLGAGLCVPEQPLAEVRLAPAGGRREARAVATHEVVEPQVQDRGRSRTRPARAKFSLQPPLAPGPWVRVWSRPTSAWRWL